MPARKTAGLVLLGIVVAGASVLADSISLGHDAGFGRDQTMGTIVGLAITAVGL